MRKLFAVATVAAIFSQAAAAQTMTSQEMVSNSLALARAIQSKGANDVVSTMSSCVESRDDARKLEREGLPEGVVRPAWENAGLHCKMMVGLVCDSNRSIAPQDHCMAARRWSIRR